MLYFFLQSRAMQLMPVRRERRLQPPPATARRRARTRQRGSGVEVWWHQQAAARGCVMAEAGDGW
jgi:hypothetical protein